jgi:hypothetical protein
MQDTVAKTVEAINQVGSSATGQRERARLAPNGRLES